MMRLLFDQHQYRYQKIDADTAGNVSEQYLL
jgi:hypothetical protein